MADNKTIGNAGDKVEMVITKDAPKLPAVYEVVHTMIDVLKEGGDFADPSGYYHAGDIITLATLGEALTKRFLMLGAIKPALVPAEA